MGLWDKAQNFVDMSNATISAFQTIDRLTRLQDPNFDLMKVAMRAVRAVVLAVVEGYQGKISGRILNDAINAMLQKLNDGQSPSVEMIEQFQGALS